MDPVPVPVPVDADPVPLDPVCTRIPPTTRPADDPLPAADSGVGAALATAGPASPDPLPGGPGGPAEPPEFWEPPELW